MRLSITHSLLALVAVTSSSAVKGDASLHINGLRGSGEHNVGRELTKGGPFGICCVALNGPCLDVGVQAGDCADTFIPGGTCSKDCPNAGKGPNADNGRKLTTYDEEHNIERVLSAGADPVGVCCVNGISCLDGYKQSRCPDGSEFFPSGTCSKDCPGSGDRKLKEAAAAVI